MGGYWAWESQVATKTLICFHMQAETLSFRYQRRKKKKNNCVIVAQDGKPDTHLNLHWFADGWT